jgi:CelD/BcsL family acetyltransferase involved in cellulose biosynthesis
MQVEVYNTFSDKKLEKAWDRLYNNENIFPQMSYGWCSSWWKEFNDNRELYIICVTNHDDTIVAIVPLLIESVRFIGAKQIRSLPVHFGDFYSFIIDSNADKALVTTEILKHLKSYSKWDTYYLFNINSESHTFKLLESQNLKYHKIIDCITANINVSNIDDYIGNLKKNLRQDIRKRVRKVERNHDVELKCFTEREDFQMNFDMIVEFYEKRWENDSRPKRPKKYYDCLNSAVSESFDKREACLYVLFIDQRAVAYRLGFIKNNTFYDWKTSFNHEFNSVSPGKIIMKYIFEDLIDKGYKKLNFMAGYYDYKLNWSPDLELTTNYFFIGSGQYNLKGRLYVFFLTDLKDRFKNIYSKSSKYHVIRKLLSWFVKV